MNKKILFFAVLLVTYISSFAQYTFKHIPIGGGGFVTGVISNKATGDIYCRTDVGGAYRWDATNNKWVQLLDWVSGSESGFYGVEALAIDKQNPNNIYMLCGTSYVSSGRTAILKSTDKGNSFTYVDVTSKFKAHGNGYGRGNGERLAVDPNNSNILFCGTRDNGLWKSTDAGATWNLAWSGVTTTPNGNGICFVVFDPSTASGGKTNTIYIGISRTGSDNIYKSTDGGVTFTPMSATTAYFPHRFVLQGTTGYVTYADNEGPATTNNEGRVYKLNTTTNSWTNVTPLTWGIYSLSFGGVDIDPSNVNRVVVSTTGNYNNNQYGTTGGDFVYFSADGGTTWTVKNGSNSTFDNNGIGIASGQCNWAECAVFDPLNSNKVRVVGGGGIFTTSDISATNPTWFYDVIGIEETAFLDGVSIPGGPLICAMGDMTGFLFTDLTTYPSEFLKPGTGTNRSVAYASANVNKVVRTSDADAHVYYSTNKGTSWTACPTSMGSGGRAVLSADGGTILHYPSNLLYYSTNNGTSWAQSSGINFWGGIPVADPVNSNYIYMYNPSDGNMWVSSNKGASFSVAGNAGSSSAPWSTSIPRAVPGLEGNIWVPEIANGLKYSTDHGVTYTTVSNVTYCKSIAFGKSAIGSSFPTIFIWGTVSGVTGLFTSIDKGASWVRMNDDAHEFGGFEFLVGDPNIFGRVYTGGGGVIYWDSPAPTIITMKNKATDMAIDGMYRYNSGSIAGQWTYSGNPAQQWVQEVVGNYVRLKNLASGLYIDGNGQTTPGSAAYQSSSNNDWNLQWSKETVGAYTKFRNRNTGLYLDGMWRGSNSDLGQYSSSTGDPQLWEVTTVSGSPSAKMLNDDKVAIEDSTIDINFYPNPFVNDFKVVTGKSGEPFRVTVFDILGRKVETAESTSDQLSMGSTLMSGLYVVQVEEVKTDLLKIFKIVKK